MKIQKRSSQPASNVSIETTTLAYATDAIFCRISVDVNQEKGHEFSSVFLLFFFYFFFIRWEITLRRLDLPLDSILKRFYSFFRCFGSSRRERIGFVVSFSCFFSSSAFASSHFTSTEDKINVKRGEKCNTVHNISAVEWALAMRARVTYAPQRNPDSKTKQDRKVKKKIMRARVFMCVCQATTLKSHS